MSPVFFNNRDLAGQRVSESTLTMELKLRSGGRKEETCATKMSGNKDIHEPEQ